MEDAVFPGNLVLMKPNLVRIPPSENDTATRWEVTRVVADLVAADAVAGQIMGYDPLEVIIATGLPPVGSGRWT